MVEDCEGLEYMERLRVLGLTTLETRRVRADMVEVYKILHGIEGVREEVFFVRNNAVTRGHGFKLFKKRVRLDVGKFSFGNRVCELWNGLPDGVVNACSINVFKCGVDYWLRHNRGFK